MELPEFPPSQAAGPIKDTLNKLINSVEQAKVPSSSQQLYKRVLKEIEWGLSKVTPRWPEEVERTMDNLRNALADFDKALFPSKGSSFICGGSKGKDAEECFRSVAGYQQVFPVVGHYQDKNLRQDLIANVLSIYEKENQPGNSKVSVPLHDSRSRSKSKSRDPEPASEPCQYCRLFLSLSLQPNGYVAKSLLGSLPDTEWVTGILYEEGKILPLDIPKAVQYYKKGEAKGVSDSIYRLGSLNERGEYGKPYEYLEMWKRAAEMGNLEAITDMGFIFEKGLVDEEVGRTIVEKNSQKAHEYYLRAARENFPRGLNNLGSFYQLDPAFRSREKSLEHFDRAVEAGYVKAMFNLGLCHSQGFAGTPDPRKARQLFKRAADLGDHYSKLFYVDLLLNGDTAACSEDELYEAHRFCREMIAEEDDRAEAYYFLGIMYEAGLGAPQEPKTALLYFTKAAKLSYVHGIMKLADCYRTGFGVEQDHRQALRLYEEASKTKPEALVSIGLVYEEGSELVARNYEKAFNFYFEACNRGVAEGFGKVAAMYRFVSVC